ncbi:MAG: hypothetical protein NC913_03650 [Candidatus Omnitrophica bacterium]|nr:hypothetical protein [Candidatus Omnitrophota bacterium]
MDIICKKGIFTKLVATNERQEIKYEIKIFPSVSSMLNLLNIRKDKNLKVKRKPRIVLIITEEYPNSFESFGNKNKAPPREKNEIQFASKTFLKFVSKLFLTTNFSGEFLQKDECRV